MSEEYYCTICANDFPKPGEEYSGSTIDNCKGCDITLKHAKEHLRPPMPPGVLFTGSCDETHNCIAAILINRNRPLEALNFCLSSLNVSSAACPTHTSYDPTVALKELTRYNESDFNPDLPPPIKFQPRLTYLSYTFALAAFKVYGPSAFSAFRLRRAYHLNPCLYELLAQDALTAPWGPGIEVSAMYLPFKRLWGSLEIQKWLNESRGEVKKKTCDAVECGKVEETVGQWKLCSGCRKRWYCGVGCQKRDWGTGGHKRVSKDEQELRRLLDSF